MYDIPTSLPLPGGLLRWSHLAPVLSLLILAPAQAAKREKKESPVTGAAQAGPSIASPKNLFLSNSPSEDPHLYIGRFVADGTNELDESNSHKTQCSTFVSYEKVGAGKMERDEVFWSSTAAAGAFNIPFVRGSGTGQNTAVVRIHYTATNKMMSDIADPSAFEACCKAAADQCTGRYIGEFMEGTGTIYYALGQEGDIDIAALGRVGAGEIEIKNGMVWRAGFTFPNPVYFAFKTTDSGFGSGGEENGVCKTSWQKVLPKSTQGYYFVGKSPWLDDESLAQTKAMDDARNRISKWLSISVQNESSDKRGYGGGGGSGSSTFSGGDSSANASSAALSQVAEQCFSTEEEATPNGRHYRVSSLAFVPKSAVPTGTSAPPTGL